MSNQPNPFDFSRTDRLQEKADSVELWKKPPPKITFYCPKCKTALVVGADQAGQKSDCPVCGQRLEAPRPASNKTVLGSLEPPPPPPPKEDAAERLASTALIFAAIGVVIAGFPLGIIAAILATISLSKPTRHTRMTAIVALSMGVIVAFLHALFILFLVASLHRR